MLTRAIKVTLKWISKRKRRQIEALLESYRAAVNFFLPLVWKQNLKLTSANSALLLNTRLTVRYRDHALREAIALVAKTLESAFVTGNTASCPVFHGRAILDSKFVSVETGRKSFDLVVRLSTLDSGTRITLPTRRTKVLKKWLRRAGATLVQGAGLSEDSLVLWVTFPTPAKPEPLRITPGDVLGIDVGVVKLLATSEGEFLGTDFRAVRDKIRRKQPGSKAKRRARTERDHLVNYCVKRLPWDRFSVVGHEDLRGIKRGKKKGRGRSFRKVMNSWRATAVANRLAMLAEEHGKWRVPVEARNTSKQCPSCGYAHTDNRNGNVFRCLKCGYFDDSDHVGSLNVKTRAFGGLPAVVAQAEEDARKATAKAIQKEKSKLARAAKQRVRYAEKRSALADLKKSGVVDFGGRTCRSAMASAPRKTGERTSEVRDLVGSAPLCVAPCAGLSARGTSSENPEGELRPVPVNTRRVENQDATRKTSGPTLGRSAVESPRPKRSSLGSCHRNLLDG